MVGERAGIMIWMGISFSRVRAGRSSANADPPVSPPRHAHQANVDAAAKPAYGVLDCSAIAPGARWQSRPLSSTTMDVGGGELEAPRCLEPRINASKHGADECPRKWRDDMWPTLRWPGPTG